MKSLALSAPVSPLTIHFWVLDESPLLGPGREPSPCNIYRKCVCVCVCVCTHCHSVMSKSLQLPGSSVHGILEARILEWVAIPFYRGSSQPRDQNPCLTLWQVGSLPLSQPGNIIWEVYMWLNFCLTPANMSYYGNGWGGNVSAKNLEG